MRKNLSGIIKLILFFTAIYVITIGTVIITSGENSIPSEKFNQQDSVEVEPATQTEAKEEEGIEVKFVIMMLPAGTETVSEETEPMDATCAPQEDIVLNDEDVDILAKLIWGEARGVQSKDVQAAVVWCVLNRVDDDYFPDTIEDVVTQSGQFMGYGVNFPVEQEFRELAEDVLTRWHKEKNGEVDVGRTLPSDYLYFTGDGVILFAKGWHDTDYFDWTLPSPYQ